MSILVCPWLHSGVRCDGCGVTPVSGYRYVCQVRPDFDLCSSCFRREAPWRQQQFLKITRNNISQPFQIEYIDCHDCGVAPIEGPRYQHKTRANYDLCEVCFKSATTSKDSRAPLNAQESHYEKIEETKIRSLRKKQTPAQLGFNYDLIIIKNQEFVAAYRPDPSRFYHLRVMCCVDCGPTLPMYGPAYKHQRKENKARCVSCYLNVKEEKKCHYTRVDPPWSLETASPYRFQPSLPWVAHNASQISTSARHATPHVSRSNSAPVPWSLRGTPSHVLPPTTRSYSMPTAPPNFYQSPSSYYSYGQQSGSVQPNGSHPGSYQNSTRYGTYQSPYSQHPGYMHNAAAASATAAATDAASQRYSTMYHHSVAQSAQMQQQMIMNAELQNLLRHSLQSQNSSQYMWKILDNLSNIGGTGGGGVDYSTLTGGGGGGPDGGGVDYSSLMGAAGGAAGGGVDLSSITGGGGASAGAVIGNLVSNFGGLGLI